jgi:hypothetical protein
VTGMRRLTKEELDSFSYSVAEVRQLAPSTTYLSRVTLCTMR